MITDNSSESAVIFFHDEDEECVEAQLSIHDLEQLHDWFHNHHPQPVLIATSRGRPGIVVEREAGLMSLDEFRVIVASILHSHRFDEQLDDLFNKLDTSGDGYVDWNEFCTYMLIQLKEGELRANKSRLPFQAEARIRHIVQNRLSTTTKVIAVGNPCKYLSVSKEGVVCVWDRQLRLERTYDTGKLVGESTNQKRRVKEWVTDAVAMDNCQKIVIASTGRDLRFFDTTSNIHVEEYHLFGLPTVPCCLHYSSNKKDGSSPSVLLAGDDHGCVWLFHFSRPSKELFDMQLKKDTPMKIYYSTIWEHASCVRVTRVEHVNSGPISAVSFHHESDVFFTCSADPAHSVVCRDVHGAKKAYTFQQNKGCDCFDFSKNLNMLVTGSSDHMVRLWNPYVPSKVISVLEGHVTGILDVRIHEGLKQVFSFSHDAVLKSWDLCEHVCLQTVSLKFPSSLLGRTPEYGPFPVFFHQSTDTLVLAAGDYLASLPITSQDVDTARPQLTACIYSSPKHCVITGADDSAITVWDVDTGKKKLVFINAHGHNEIKCMALNTHGNILYSLAKNSGIKVWNTQNGHEQHLLEPAHDSDIVNVLLCDDRSTALSVTTNHSVTKYPMEGQHETYCVTGDTSWRKGHVTTDDVICAVHCPPFYMATATSDGEMLLWNLETESLLLTVRDRAIERLMFLSGRVHEMRLSGQTDGATLVSSEAGYLRWWNVYGRLSELGSFYVPINANELVLALNANMANSELVTGDTGGWLAVWHIANYCRTCGEPSQPPDKVQSWKAHLSAISYVSFVEHASGVFVLSSSSDSVKLWTVGGSHVGTFGQTSWHLSVSSTWQCSHANDTSTEDNSLQQADQQQSSGQLEPERTSSKKEIKLGRRFDEHMERMVSVRQARRQQQQQEARSRPDTVTSVVAVDSGGKATPYHTLKMQVLCDVDNLTLPKLSSLTTVQAYTAPDTVTLSTSRRPLINRH